MFFGVYYSKFMPNKCWSILCNQNICEIICRTFLKSTGLTYFPMISTQDKFIRPTNYITQIMQQKHYVSQGWYTYLWYMYYFFQRISPYLPMAPSVLFNISPHIKPMRSSSIFGKGNLHSATNIHPEENKSINGKMIYILNNMGVFLLVLLNISRYRAIFMLFYVHQVTEYE